MLLFVTEKEQIIEKIVITVNKGTRMDFMLTIFVFKIRKND